MIVERLDGLVCDMDGVLYRGSESIPGAIEAVEALRARGVRLVFCTNNSRSTVEQYLERLHSLGIEAGPEEVLTSAVVTAEVLARRGGASRRALVVGGEGLSAALASIGIELTDDPDSADLVAVGWDPAFDYVAMRRATRAVRGGADLIATNDDAAFPAGRNGDLDLWPGAGAILASIEVASGRKAEVMGKPHRPMMEAAAERLAGARRIVIIGDRAETDLAGGEAMGWTTILVLSGVTSRADVETVEPKPDVVLDSIADLPDLLG
jgi:phosphoglycolate/pyridoxal phosphate phosphatase family enzyme